MFIQILSKEGIQKQKKKRLEWGVYARHLS